MPLIQTKGAASAQGFGEFSRTAAANWIEDCFSCFLYTGNNSTQTITNGVDLAGKGGLVWLKGRNTAGTEHELTDTARGTSASGNALNSNDTQPNQPGDLTAFNSNGFNLSYNTANGNASGTNYVSWTFRKQPKFFDVVTYTGNGTTQNIAHSLGSTPGCIIVKSTNNTFSWGVYHRSYPNGYLFLNSTNAGDTTNAQNMWGNNSTVVAPTSTQFTVGSFGTVNSSGTTYVAYLFAHDAGGFGASGTDNVISCGSYTGTGSVITLGYEPQWILLKNSNSIGNWILVDNMRGLPVGGNSIGLFPNLSDAESSVGNLVDINATGFKSYLDGTCIYIAIRRGPMRTPTTGTSVFTTNTYTGTGAARTITTGFVTDLVIGQRLDNLSGHATADRLRGDTKYLQTNDTSAEATSDGGSQDITGFDVQTGYTLGVPNNSWMNNNGSSCANWAFRRAPGFFDVVCYTGTGSNQTVTHNLGVAPELMIIKRRNDIANWATYAAPLGNTKGFDGPNTDGAAFTSSLIWNNTTPTATVFTVGTASSVNLSSSTYVAYLFATVAGVSKVFSYTGNGSSQTINCGFTGGARFVLIKRTDSTGDWYVWDSARGIVAANDPHLSLNSTAAEVTTDDSVDTDSTGFVVNQVAATNVNVTSATYIGLAIA